MKKQTNVSIPVLGIYSRVSSAASLKGLSLDTQIKNGIEQAVKIGWQYEVFKEGVLTGNLSYQQRPELNKLVDKILTGEIQGLYCSDLDRMSRDVNDGQYLISFLIENKTKLFDSKGEIDILDENQELISRIRNIFSALERKKIALRMKSGKDAAAKMGRVKGGQLLAYGYKKSDTDKMMVIDEEQAKVVRRVFDLAIAGLGTKKISNLLNEENVPTKRMLVDNGKMTVRGKEQKTFKWRDATIYQMLTNSLYMGERKYNTDQITESPVIVEPYIYEAVQQLLVTRNNFKDTNNKNQFLIKGVTYCGKCGARYQGRVSASMNSYFCSTYRYKGERCGNPAVKIDYIEELVWSQLLKLDIQVKEYYKWSAGKKMNEVKAKRKFFKEIKERKENIANLVQAIEKGGNFEILNERLAVNKSELDELQFLSNAHDESISVLKKEDEVISMIKAHLVGHNKFSFEQKQNVVRALIDRITINEGGVVIEYKINALTNVKLGNKIDITSKLLKHGIKSNTVTNTSLVIKQNDAGDIINLTIK